LIERLEFRSAACCGFAGEVKKTLAIMQKTDSAANSTKQLTFGSLFAGIGGFDLGFERAGMVCKWQVEIDDYATKILEKHWPHVHRERDVRTVGRHNLEQVDIVCGGFPCQDISYAGHGAGLDGARSGLFFEAIRLVCELRPRFLVLENVAALLTRGMDRVLGTLAEIGYDAEWHCIPAAAVGAPHLRNRIFIVAYTNDGQRKRPELAVRSGRDAVRTGGETLANTSHELRQKGKGVQSRHRDKAIRTDERNGFRRPNDDWWEAEPDVGRVANGIPARVDRLRGLGNAVVPQVAEVVARRVLELA
jgi:DNA (cytosine-5)-methyltransferase 1